MQEKKLDHNEEHEGKPRHISRIRRQKKNDFISCEKECREMTETDRQKDRDKDTLQVILNLGHKNEKSSNSWYSKWHI